MAGLKIRKGDRVKVIAGKDKGKEGLVSRAIPTVDKVLVDGVNVAKRHQKPTRAMQQGGIIDKDMPIHVSNLAIICGSCSKPTRVGYRFETDGTKVRVCRKCGSDI